MYYVTYTNENYINSKSNENFEFTCEECGNIFYRNKRYISRNRLILPKFCSKECSCKNKNFGEIIVKCKFCGNDKKIKRSEYNKSKTGNFFCNNSCAAKFNNILYSKKQKTKIAKNKKNEKNIGDNELGYYIGYETNRKKYISSKCQTIRRNAKQIIESNKNIEKVCAICKNHEFDKILEVHHIKSIASFKRNTKIREINSIDNLIWLCPNHHTMVEKGLIDLTQNGTLV